MTTAADMFIQYTEDILAVARRVHSRGITVYAYECNSLQFCSWSLAAGVDRERFQFRWEGRALVLTILKVIRVEGRLDSDRLHTLNVRHPEAVNMMEIFLQERFAAQQIPPVNPAFPPQFESDPSMSRVTEF